MSVAEVPHAGEHHGQATLVRRVDHFLVAHRAAGLDHAGGARLDRLEQAVGEGEEGVRGDGRALRRAFGKAHGLRHPFGLLRGDHRAVDAAHLAGADADGLAGLGIDDGVRLHMLGDLPGKEQVFQLFLRGGALGHHLQVVKGDVAVVLALHEEAARHLAIGGDLGFRVGQRAGDQQPHVLLLCHDRLRRLVDGGGDDDLREDLGDRLGGFRVERLVQRDDAAEGRGAVAVEGALVGVEQAGAGGDATGVGVLDDRAGRGLGAEFGDEFKGRVGVVDVVVGQFLALQLFRRGNARAVRAVEVEGRLLVRVLAIAQGLGEGAGEGAPARRVLVDRARHPGADRRVIGRGAGIGDLREVLAEFVAGGAVLGVELLQHRLVILHVDHGRDEGMVLRGGADHCRPADVDVLDAGLVIGALGDGFLERVEVDDEQVDRLDVMGGHRGEVLLVVAQRQQAAVHLRVQRLHPAVHHLGKARHLGHIAHAQPGLAQRLGGAAGRQQLDAAGGKRAGKVDQPGLVGDGDQGAGEGDVSGHGWQSLCSEVDWRIGNGVTDGGGGILCLGQGPADLDGMVIEAAGKHDLLCGARPQPALFEIDRGFEAEIDGGVEAEHPDLTRFQRHRHRPSAHVERGVDIGVQMEADLKGDAAHPLALEHGVEALAVGRGHRAERVLAAQGAAVGAQLQLTHMGQPVRRHIAVMAEERMAGRIAFGAHPDLARGLVKPGAGGGAEAALGAEP
ncbi:hypothetical protein SDC9_06342 [bioreactor metagenome]|uniref:NAD-specific glutamate dehydrogenase n=1 Tax=bioreactor metagenome TaxID=1076179 RepID=A0A644T1I2_9ZZZZ